MKPETDAPSSSPVLDVGPGSVEKIVSARVRGLKGMMKRRDFLSSPGKKIKNSRDETSRVYARRYTCARVTVDSKSGRMAGGPGFVRRGASVLAGVSGRDRIDRQDAQTLALRDRELIGTFGGYRHTIERPGNVHREVPLLNGAGRRDRLARVHRLVAECEREDLRSNCDRGSCVRETRQSILPRRRDPFARSRGPYMIHGPGRMVVLGE